jgi:hypothetical protein
LLVVRAQEDRQTAALADALLEVAHDRAPAAASLLIDSDDERVQLPRVPIIVLDAANPA